MKFVKKPLFVLLLLGLLLRLFLSIQIYSGDVNNHISWGKDSLKRGFSGIYERDFWPEYGTMTPTYPPIPIFLFTAFYWLFDWSYKISWSLNLSLPIFPSNLIYFFEDQDTLPAYLKIPAIFADLGIAIVVYFFVARLTGPVGAAAGLVLFNPAFFYNSAYWGQIEAIPLFFTLWAFYLLLYSPRFIAASVIFTLALLAKQSSIIFIPIFALVFLMRFGVVRGVKAVGVLFILFWAAFLPFFKSGNIFLFPFTTYLDKIQTGSGSDYIVDHAFNLWAYVLGLGKVSDSTSIFLGISYQVFGYLLFSLILCVLLYTIYKRKACDIDVISVCCLTAFAAFLFLTRMHERYLEPALPFLLIVALNRRRLLWIFLAVSVFYFSNLYHNWWAPRVDWLVSTLSSKSVVDTMILVVLGLFVFLFLRHIKGEHYDKSN